MLHRYSLVMGNAVLIAVVFEVYHNEGISSSDLLGWLDNRGLIKGRCVGVDGINNIAARKAVHSSKDHYLRFGEIEYFIAFRIFVGQLVHSSVGILRNHRRQDPIRTVGVDLYRRQVIWLGSTSHFKGTATLEETEKTK